MREIKFRVWDKEDKRMRMLRTGHDSLWFGTGEAQYQNLQNGSGGGDYDLMQFTREKDKTEKEVWEGDIVKAKYCANGMKGRKLIGVVKWSESHIGWGIEEHANIYRMSAVPRGSLLVIGNIYENPELLKED